jgi:putative ABC transport system substrate-binding protein
LACATACWNWVTEKTKILFSAYASTAHLDRVQAFRQGLRELGYVEGQNVIVEYRYAEGKRDRMAALAAEFIRLKVDIIVSGGGAALAHIIKRATDVIPIVMTSGSDPIGAGLITSLSHPQGNVTGLTSRTKDLSGKRLELLKKVAPKISRVGVLYDPSNPPKAIEFNEMQIAARALGIDLQALPMESAEDVERAFMVASEAQVDAFIALQSPLTVHHRAQIASLALKSRRPLMVAEKGLLKAGGLMSYGPDYADLCRRAATYVDKLLKGANPANLPVEQPTKFDLVINLKTAEELGVTIPPIILFQATEIIR